jgi:hypothetical protein
VWEITLDLGGGFFARGSFFAGCFFFVLFFADADADADADAGGFFFLLAALADFPDEDDLGICQDIYHRRGVGGVSFNRCRIERC